MQKVIRLKELLQDVIAVEAKWDRDIKSIVIDSRQVTAHSLFIAYKGTQVDGREFIQSAIDKRVAAIVAETVNNQENITEIAGIPVFNIKHAQSAIGKIAARFYQYPSEQLDLIGITGTNGKTSVAHYLAQALTALDHPCAMIGTIGSGLVNNLSRSALTTPDAIAIQSQLAGFLQQDIRHVAMEVSSHALDQKRTQQVKFTTAVFTNLSQDHLDYHGTMQKYGEAKLKLFQQPNLRHAIINFDDPFSKIICEVLPANVQSYTYSLSNTAADIYVTDVHHSNHGMSAKIVTPWGKGELQTQLIGEFNLNNLLCVIGCLCVRGFKLFSVLQILSLTRGAMGRMEVFKSRANISLIVDYAHTPDALQQALLAVKQHCQGKVWCVFGCGGDRDKDKRHKMGEISENYADHIIITNDNPRSEDPNSIIEDILQGIKNPSKVQIEMNRKQAIISAYEQAKENDMILIAGKGHENYQLIKDEKLEFSDIELAQELAKSSIVEPS